MNKKRTLALAIIVTATTAVVGLQNVFAPSPAELPVHTLTSTSTPTQTITLSPAYEGCSFMWAYHDDPRVSTKLHEAVVALDPSASANAQLFGEDCVYADGHATFSTMETDFYIRLPVEDLTIEEVFGNWIKQVMDLVVDLPKDEIQGRKGFVEFSFIKNDAERLIIRVEINDYLGGAVEKSGIALFQEFYTPVPPPTTPLPITPTSTP
jgi:hypothetical protein